MRMLREAEPVDVALMLAGAGVFLIGMAAFIVAIRFLLGELLG